MLIYIDESGFCNNWVFVAVKIPNERDARLCIKKWRRYAASVSAKFAANEYRDRKAPDRQREKILKEISAMGFRFWALYYINYRGHRLDYSEAIFQILKEVALSDVSLVILDRVERNSRYMEKNIEKIKKWLSCECSIIWGNSEKEKGIQVADAICGAVSRKYNNICAPNYFYIIEHLMLGYKII